MIEKEKDSIPTDAILLHGRRVNLWQTAPNDDVCNLKPKTDLNSMLEK